MDKLAECAHAFEKNAGYTVPHYCRTKRNSHGALYRFLKTRLPSPDGSGKIKRPANLHKESEADYLLSTPYIENDIYIFLSKHKDIDQYFCRSFFPKEQRDYTKGQAIYTMIYKEKISMSTGMVQIQYDHLTPIVAKKVET